MAKYYYNSETRTCGVNQTVSCTLTTDPHYEAEKRRFWYAVKAGDEYQDPFKHFAPKTINTIEELCEVVKQAGFSGSEKFIAADGTLYAIYQEGAFEYAPLEHDGQHSDAGINWATKFFFTKEAAQAFGESLNAGRKHEDGYFRWDDPEYHEELDTWSVHYHCYAD